MKFAVGYQVPAYGSSTSELVSLFKNHISEVYFAWPGMASGRPPLADEDYSREELAVLLIRELKAIRADGCSLDLLFNANCYGSEAVSLAFEKEILATIGTLADNGVKPQTITTTSPFVATVVKREFPDIELRASVNMRIGTIQAMQYVADLFDSFYLQRDYQRDIGYVKTISAWCRRHGKKLCLLANSGCLRFCPGQSFHDNLIAHCAEIETKENMPDFNPHTCWKLYQKPENRAEILKSTWIRPEDICRYEELVDVVKLATRQHSHPATVIGAYAAGKWDGDLLELLEPGFSPAFYPYYLDNRRIPDDFFEKTSHCTLGCTDCGYCESIFSEALRSYENESMAGFLHGMDQ